MDSCSLTAQLLQVQGDQETPPSLVDLDENEEEDRLPTEDVASAVVVAVAPPSSLADEDPLGPSEAQARDGDRRRDWTVPAEGGGGPRRTVDAL